LRSWFARHPFLVSQAFVLPLLTYAVVWETPHFETNDDVWMMLTLSGQVTSLEPTAFIIWMNLFFCQALAWLYSAADSVSWYGLMQVSSIIIAVEVMLYALIIQGVSIERVLLFVLCLISFALPVLIRLQFTKTSFLVGLSGIFLLYATLLQQPSPWLMLAKTLTRLLGVVLLLTLSFLIRKESLYLVVSLSIPLLLYLAWQTWRARTFSLLLITMLAVGLLLSGLDYGHQRAYAQDPEWRRFNELLRLKSQFIDYNNIQYNPETQPYFTAVGWSENDYQMLIRWFYVDPVRYSPEHLRAIIAHFPAMAKPPAHVQQALLVLFSRLHTDGVLWVTIPLLLGIALLGLRSKGLVLVLFATVVVAGVIMVVLMIFLKLPERIYQPIVMAVGWYALLLSTGDRSLNNQERFPRIINACGLFFIAITILLHLCLNSPLAQAVTFSYLTASANRALRAAFVQLTPQSSQTFVSWGGAFSYEAILPLESKDYLRNFRLIGLGATNQSPLQQRLLAAQGIPDLPRALFERDDVFITFRPDMDAATYLATYIAEHYGVRVTAIPVFDSGPVHFSQVRRVKDDSVPEPALKIGQAIPLSPEHSSLFPGREGLSRGPFDRNNVGAETKVKASPDAKSR